VPLIFDTGETAKNTISATTFPAHRMHYHWKQTSFREELIDSPEFLYFKGF
jgi:hypothetical protein